MANSLYSSIEDEPFGKEIEGETISIAYDIIGDNCRSVVGTRLDKEQGVDCIIYGVPCDITINIGEKDNMDSLAENIDLDYATVKFGVRTGNKHHPFDEPVLVIGIDAGGVYKFRQEHICIMERVRKTFREIIDIGQDQYWEWVDNHDRGEVTR